jgi:two-component system sensor kinase FixL
VTQPAPHRVGRFAVASLLGMVIIGLVIALYSRDTAIKQLKSLGIGQHETLARTLMTALQRQIEPVLKLPADATPEALRQDPMVTNLRQYLVDPLVGMKVVRVKIYDRSGRTVFSTEASQIGEDASRNDAWTAALGGEVVAEMVHKNAFNVSDGIIEDRDLLETYVPVRERATGEVLGVFEVYTDMTGMVAQIDDLQRRVVITALLVVGTILTALVALFRRVDRELKVEQVAAARYLREVQDARENLEQRVSQRTHELAMSEQRFADVAEAAGEYIWETDATGRFTFVSDRVSTVLGYAPRELLGRAPMELAPEDDAALVRRHFADHGTDAPFAALEHRSYTHDGRLVWLSVSGVPVRDEHGVFLGHRGAAHDVSARKAAEQSLRKLSLVIEQSSEITIITDTRGVIEYVNPAFTAIFGYTAEEVLGKTPAVLRSGLVSDQTYGELWRTIRAGDTWRGEICNRAKDGSLFWNLVAIFPLRDEAGTITHFVGLQSDINERKRGEQALLTSEARLRAVMDSVDDAILTSDAQGIIDMVNPAAERLFGYERGELVGADLRMLMPSPYRDEHAAYMERYMTTGEARIIGRTGREVRGLRRDGTEIPLELAVAEIRTGAERRFVGVLRDLTERKRAERELERTRQQYFHREKIAAMGQLAAGIVHEVGNPAAAISGAVSALRHRQRSGKDGIGTDATVVRNLDLIAEQSDRLAAMTREISDFARPRETRRSLLDLNQIVRGAVSIMRFDPRVQDAELVLDLDPELPALHASQDQLTQVVLNLVLNAADACEERADEASRIDVRTLRADSGALLMVSDNGVGMDAETIQHAMDPYFSTKGQERGMGLGLALCHDIVTEHGGEISIQSMPGAGTTVRVRLLLDGEA